MEQHTSHKLQERLSTRRQHVIKKGDEEYVEREGPPKKRRVMSVAPRHPSMHPGGNTQGVVSERKGRPKGVNKNQKPCTDDVHLFQNRRVGLKRGAETVG